MIANEANITHKDGRLQTKHDLIKGPNLELQFSHVP